MNDKERVALSSVGASAALTIAKGVVGLSTGSLAILSEAAHSLIDFGRHADDLFRGAHRDKPADEEHHYGHGKVEKRLGARRNGDFCSCFPASSRGSGSAPVRRPWPCRRGHAGGVCHHPRLDRHSTSRAPARSRALPPRRSSQALEADALHFSSDMWSSAAVLVGLVGIRFGYNWADSAAALVVALFVCLAGWRLGRRTIDALTDNRAGRRRRAYLRIARRVRNVVSVERVRAREVGATLFGEIEVGASRTLPLDRVERLKSDIETAVRTALPHAQISVSVIPRALDNETVMERVMVIARNRALAVHHVTVHAIAGKLSISLDLEIDGNFRWPPPTTSRMISKPRSATSSVRLSRSKLTSSRCR